MLFYMTLKDKRLTMKLFVKRLCSSFRLLTMTSILTWMSGSKRVSFLLTQCSRNLAKQDSSVSPSQQVGVNILKYLFYVSADAFVRVSVSVDMNAFCYVWLYHKGCSIEASQQGSDVHGFWIYLHFSFDVALVYKTRLPFLGKTYFLMS